MIDLAGIDANESTGGNGSFVWRGTAAFTGRGQLRVFNQDGDTVIAGNTTGNQTADFEIQVEDGSVAAAAWRAADVLL